MSEHEHRAPEHVGPQSQDEASAPVEGIQRRTFLAGAGGAAALGTAGVLMPGVLGTSTAQATPSPTNEVERASAAYRIRVAAARKNFLAGTVAHPTNGDEAIYPERLGNFTKGLPHDASGEVLPGAYVAMLQACANRDQFSWELVPSGQPISQRRMKFVNPLGGLAFDLEGVDACNTTCPPPPAFASAQQAGELVELYWKAMLRDIPFTQYPTHPLVAQACADLNALSDFRGPRSGGLVTPATIFRDVAHGCNFGPYLSQFWWKSQPFGPQYIEPRMRTVLPNIDYLTDETSWLEVQNGKRPLANLQFDPTLRFMRNGRDLGRWVHMDVLYQAYLQALLHMMTPTDNQNPFTGGGMNCPHNVGDPYLASQMVEPFTTFGGPHYMALTAEVSTRGLKGTWFQKWFVHRRARPEEYAGHVHRKVVHNRPYPVHPDVLNSAAMARIQSLYGGNCLLPLGAPEGCPMHPSYTAGHATVAAACVTIIKAMFHTDQPIPAPMIPSDDGLTLLPYLQGDAASMTVGGELNKLAMNVAYGRHFLGVHWRSDGYDSLRLGEEIAISVLRDQRETYVEDFQGFTFRKFDGTFITV